MIIATRMSVAVCGLTQTNLNFVNSKMQTNPDSPP